MFSSIHSFLSRCANVSKFLWSKHLKSGWRSIVEILGGEVKVESELGKGSTFIVTLPTRTEDGDLDVQSPHEVNVSLQ